MERKNAVKLNEMPLSADIELFAFKSFFIIKDKFDKHLKKLLQ